MDKTLICLESTYIFQLSGNSMSLNTLAGQLGQPSPFKLRVTSMHRQDRNKKTMPKLARNKIKYRVGYIFRRVKV